MESNENCSSSKKARLESNCALCGKSSDFSEKAEEYTKLLINNLVSPFERGVFIKDEKLICLEFCVDCGNILEDFLELKKALLFISENVKSKVDEIKFYILRNENKAHSSLNTEEINVKFRKIVTRDLCPVVRLDLENVLVKKKDFENTSMDSDDFYCNTKIRSQIIEVEPGGFEYFDEEEVEPWEEQAIECYENNFVPDNCSPPQNSNNPQSSINTSEREWKIKPKLKYCQLAIIALTNSKDNSATVEDIRCFILANFPCFKNGDSFRTCINRALRDSTLFERNEVRTRNMASKCLFRFISELNPAIVEETSILLKSTQVLQTMAFPERHELFIKNLFNSQRTVPQNKIASPKELRFQKISPTKETICQPTEHAAVNKVVQSAENQWQRPPIPLSQIIFIGLSNCSGKRAKANDLIECIRNTFPFFLLNNPVKTWKQCLHTTLFINKCFARSEVTRYYDPVKDIWTIDEKEAENIRQKIKKVLQSEKLHISTFMAKPEVSLKNALSQSYEGAILNNENRSLNGVKKNSSSFMMKNLLDKSSEPKNSSANSATSCATNPAIVNNMWQLPPLNFAQMIFLALSNCPSGRGRPAEILSKIRELFPFVNGLDEKWERGATTVLLQNENFVRISCDRTDLPNLMWTLNDKTANKMRNEIKNTLRNSSAVQSHFMNRPLEILRNALIYDLSPVQCDKNDHVQERQCSDSNKNLKLKNQEASNGWIRPPFIPAQIIFIALSNCTEKQGNSIEIFKRIRTLFPWYLNTDVPETLLQGITTVLLSNDNFVRKDIASEDNISVINQTWTINENVAYSIRNEIRSIIELGNRSSLCQYLVHPEETIRKTLTGGNCRPKSGNSNGNGILPQNTNDMPTPKSPIECSSSDSTIAMEKETSPPLESITEIDINEIKIEEEFTMAPHSPINTPTATAVTIVERGDDPNKHWNIPPFTISLLTAFALANNNEEPMTSFAICESIANYFPYFQQQRKTLSERVLFSLRNKMYFAEDYNNQGLLRFYLNAQNTEGMIKLKSEMYSVFKQFYVQTYEAFSRPSELYPMLKNIMGNDFDFSFLKSVTVYQTCVFG